MNASSSLDHILAFVERGICNSRQQMALLERRRESRDEVVLTAEVTPLNSDRIPIGIPFPAVTRNLSTSGIAFVHEIELQSELIALQLDVENQRSAVLVARIVWTKPDGPFYSSGATLLAKF